MSDSSAPIGIFDSGFGGLTVLRTLLEKLPNESFVYLGDSARLPYGTKSLRTIAKYAEQNIAYLARLNVKAVVVACNSASSVLSENRHPFPVYEVITPGAQLAAGMTRNQKIGLIGTNATVMGEAYLRSLRKINPLLQVYQQPCPLFVPLVEEGWQDDPITNLIVYRYVAPLKAAGVDTLILGCTHYPVLKKSIAKVMGPDTVLIDSGEAIAATIKQDIVVGTLAKGTGASHRLLATDVSLNAQTVAERILAPHKLGTIEQVDLQT